MTDPTTSATIAALRELTGWRGNSDDDGEYEEDLDLADWQIRAIFSALQSGAIPIPDDAPQIAAQTEISDKLNREIDSIQDQWKAERSTTEAKLAAQAAEIERGREERDEARRFGEEAARRYNALLVEKRRVTCVYCGHQYPDGTPEAQDAALTEHIRTCEKHPMRAADARVAELKGLLREIRDSYHDNRAGGWPGAGDVFADAIYRIDAALSKREGGR